MLCESDIVVRSRRPLSAVVGDEIVMLSPEQGAYFGLNAVGARIWELIADPRSVASLAEALRSEYSIDAAVCRADVAEFLSQLREADLIEVRS